MTPPRGSVPPRFLTPFTITQGRHRWKKLKADRIESTNSDLSLLRVGTTLATKRIHRHTTSLWARENFTFSVSQMAPKKAKSSAPKVQTRKNQDDTESKKYPFMLRLQ
ncbi:hypothetical protein CERZMDRAFT_99607 [Cercospora zeae-maydis SCOH1-5]|uniref:Uncharacterized protein n=1 Tax=Cercospora zeae-maydis SCOH1-5 TaxID=717836 RepID=A0A6A6F9W8_9PEZI|nr:hypothetical protein CERZMDRAFT_99607 [Cercospora zeae-maydis SCOH1-5]